MDINIEVPFTNPSNRIDAEKKWCKDLIDSLIPQISDLESKVIEYNQMARELNNEVIRTNNEIQDLKSTVAELQRKVDEILN